MKTSICLVVFATIIACACAARADLLYLTGYSSTIRSSIDGGATWTNWVTGGSNYRAIASDPGSSTIFVQDRFAGTLEATRIFAFNLSGTQLDYTTYNRSGESAQCALGWCAGRMYVDHGQAGGTNGQAFGMSEYGDGVFSNKPVVNAFGGAWQGDDMTFAMKFDVNYLFITPGGGSQNPLRRYTVGGDGTLSSGTDVGLSGNSGTRDVAFTPSGRLLLMDQAGLYLSEPDQVDSSSIALTKKVTFTATENPSTGDMGSNARDFVLLGNKIYAVNNTRVYVYTLDDTAATISFDSGSAALHGFSSDHVQITGLVPEPAALGLLALAGLLIRRQRVFAN